jgi:hypothetical protein
MSKERLGADLAGEMLSHYARFDWVGLADA